MTEYFKKVRRARDLWGSGTKSAHFSYLATGNPAKDSVPDDFGDREHPYAEIEGYHEYAKYVPTFENTRQFGEPGEFDEVGATGLSDEYLEHKSNLLHERFINNNYTAPSKEEGDALSAINILSGASKSWEHKTYPWAVNQFDTNPHLAPTQLFEEVKPAKTRITRMFADPSMKSQAMTMAGMAYRDHANTTIEADNDLSPHSSKLVRGALAKGLPVVTSDRNPDAGITNDISEKPLTISTRQKEYTSEDMKQVPHSEVVSARADVRSMLRDSRPKRNTKPVTSKGLSDQFLPGMEGFV
jgi:hypothetical protein